MKVKILESIYTVKDIEGVEIKLWEISNDMFISEYFIKDEDSSEWIRYEVNEHMFECCFCHMLYPIRKKESSFENNWCPTCLKEYIEHQEKSMGNHETA